MESETHVPTSPEMEAFYKMDGIDNRRTESLDGHGRSMSLGVSPWEMTVG